MRHREDLSGQLAQDQTELDRPAENIAGEELPGGTDRAGDVDQSEPRNARRVERERGESDGDGLRDSGRAPTAGPARCSDAAAVTLAERIPLWRERLGAAGGVGGALQVLREARRSCELPAWSDEVALLRLITSAHGSVGDGIALARGAQGGAKRWFQQQAMRASRSRRVAGDSVEAR